MVGLASTLACLAIVATLQQAVAPSPKLYACQSGQCVPNARGLPLAECQQVCAPSPSANYTCQGGQCVVSGRGLPKAECTQVCGGPGPTPGPAPGGKTVVDLAVATPDLSKLVTALKAGGLVGTLSGKGPFTVFAPDNEAFAALPAGVLNNLLKPANKAALDNILAYHVVAGAVHAKDLKDGEKIKTLEGKNLIVRISGSDVFINSAKVTTADVDASNGVVHIIDGVLLPAGPAPPPGPPPGPPPPPLGNKTVVQLAEATPDLSTLVIALKAGELLQTLSGKGPFTVFAPQNEAFRKLPAGTLINLLRPENKAQLDDLLTYHVVAGRLFRKDLKSGQRLTTLEGKELTVELERDRTGQMQICEKLHQNIFTCPEVVTADVDASNGVVHIIDGVLLPGGPPKPPPKPPNTGTCKQSGCYFTTITPPGLGGPFCGEVDAAPSMPDDIWNDTKAVADYITLTVNFWDINAPDSPRHTPSTGAWLDLVQGRCGVWNRPPQTGANSGDNRGWTKPAGGTNISWTRFDVMEAVCSGGDSKFGEGCGCKYPKCPDVPDKPGVNRFCGLCGPKFNAPREVKYFRCQGKLVYNGPYAVCDPE